MGAVDATTKAIDANTAALKRLENKIDGQTAALKRIEDLIRTHYKERHNEHV